MQRRQLYSSFQGNKSEEKINEKQQISVVELMQGSII